MREIKFRAWDGHRMRYDVTGFEHGEKNEMGGVFIDGDFYHIDAVIPPPSGNGRGYRTAVVMQCTGLKDKNGREIYESDVIEYRWLEHILRGVVLWHDRGGCWLCSNICGGGLPTHGEVIGNIHENPELLHADNQSEGNSTSQEAHER